MESNRSAELSRRGGPATAVLRLFGLERFYFGSLGILGIGTVFFIVGFFILVPLSIWTFFGANVMFSGNVNDKDGRKLR